MRLLAKRGRMLAGDVITKLGTLAGRHRAHSRGKEASGSASLEEEGFGG